MTKQHFYVSLYLLFTIFTILPNSKLPFNQNNATQYQSPTVTSGGVVASSPAAGVSKNTTQPSAPPAYNNGWNSLSGTSAASGSTLSAGGTGSSGSTFNFTLYDYNKAVKFFAILDVLLNSNLQQNYGLLLCISGSDQSFIQNQTALQTLLNDAGQTFAVFIDILTQSGSISALNPVFVWNAIQQFMGGFTNPQSKFYNAIQQTIGTYGGSSQVINASYMYCLFGEIFASIFDKMRGSQAVAPNYLTMIATKLILDNTLQNTGGTVNPNGNPLITYYVFNNGTFTLNTQYQTTYNSSVNQSGIVQNSVYYDPNDMYGGNFE